MELSYLMIEDWILIGLQILTRLQISWTVELQSSNPVLDPGQHCPTQETTILEQRLVLEFPGVYLNNVIYYILMSLS